MWFLTSYCQSSYAKFLKWTQWSDLNIFKKNIWLAGIVEPDLTVHAREVWFMFTLFSNAYQGQHFASAYPLGQYLPWAATLWRARRKYPYHISLATFSFFLYPLFSLDLCRTNKRSVRHQLCLSSRQGMFLLFILHTPLLLGNNLSKIWFP